MNIFPKISYSEILNDGNSANFDELTQPIILSSYFYPFPRRCLKYVYLFLSGFCFSFVHFFWILIFPMNGVALVLLYADILQKRKAVPRF